jgi:hypothetical protein
MKHPLAFAAAATMLNLAAPAFSHGNVTCGGGPKSAWKPVAALQSALIAQGWAIKKAKPEKDCYEVYGKTPEGLNVEAFFHPVTLQKVKVLQRGRVIYQAPAHRH